MHKLTMIIQKAAIIPPDPSFPAYKEQAVTIMAMAFILLAIIIMMISAIYHTRKQTDSSRQWTNRETKSGKIFWRPSQTNETNPNNEHK